MYCAETRPVGRKDQLETKDLLNATMSLLEEYYNAHDSSVEPATIEVIDPTPETGDQEE